jgi:type I restriction enzyme M protein
MLDNGTKKRIDSARDILVGKVPDPKSQVEQITIAMIYKFMDDMDNQTEELGGKSTFFTGKFKEYAWSRLLDRKLGGHERLLLYAEGLEKMNINENIPQLFRDIFKGVFLPYRDPETLNLFLKEINGFAYDHSERLGDAFEYLLSVLSSQGDAGQFRTPRHVIDFMVEIVNPAKENTVLDPACGTAGFLISSYKHILRQNTKSRPGDLLTTDDKGRLMTNFCGYDISPDMVRLSLVNMYLHSFANPSVHEYDTLTSEDRWDERYDVIMANPPFMSPKGGIRPHSRFAINAKRSEVLFVDYIAEHLNVHGRAGVIVPEGIIFQSQNAYKNLRKMLVDEGYLYAVVSLPAGIFQPYSGVKTSILLMDKTLAKKSDEILFVKVANDGFDLGAQRRPIDKNDLPQALKIVKAWKQAIVEGKDFELNAVDKAIAHTVSKEKIAESGDYNLSGDRYKEVISCANVKWPMVELVEACDFFTDGDWVERKDQSHSGIRLIQTGNIGLGEFLNKEDKAKFVSEKKFKALDCTEVFKGDVLISRLPDPVGRACLVPKLETRMITAVDCTIVRFSKDKMLPQLFIYFTKTDSYFKNISRYLTGSSRQRISRSNLSKVGIPLPPLEVQEKIVAELDSYQKIINGAKQVVENYKPAIKIDPDWPMMELEEISHMKRGPFGGSLKKEIFVKQGYKVYEQKHAINGDFTIGKYFIDKKKYREMEAFAIAPNDLLISCSGTMGKVVIVPEDAPKGIINQALLKVTPNNSKVLPFYLKCIIESEDVQRRYFQSTNGAAIQNVGSMKVMKKIPVPLPSLKIQEKIVAEIEAERELVEANTKLIEIFEKKIKDKIGEVWGE